MNSNAAGKNISEIEVQNVSKYGIWLFIRGREYYMPYDKFPWFKKANISQIIDVSFSPNGNLHWPQLDVDLSIEILEAPERFPLIAK
jgi:hypothetical protein